MGTIMFLNLLKWRLGAKDFQQLTIIILTQQEDKDKFNKKMKKGVRIFITASGNTIVSSNFRLTCSKGIKLTNHRTN